MTRYKQAFDEMLLRHKTVFDEFGRIHDLYIKDQEKYQSEFNELGARVRRIAEEAERVLCGKMEGGVHGKYSNNLAEKFRAEVRMRYKAFDLIGMTIT